MVPGHSNNSCFHKGRFHARDSLKRRGRTLRLQAALHKLTEKRFAIADGDKAIVDHSKLKGRKHDQIDRCCCLCLSCCNVGASHVARAASSAGCHDYASRLWMRAG
jgi:hypothetical protein